MGNDNFMITAPNYAAESIWAIRDNVKNGRNFEALDTERKLMMLTAFIMNMSEY